MRFANEHGFCEIDTFPACKWLGVSTRSYVYPDHRGKGHGTENHKLRLERASQMGYSALICTVRDDNSIEKQILRKSGWEQIWVFTNPEQETIVVWARKTR